MVAPLINYKREHEVKIDTTRVMNNEEFNRVIKYGAHSLALKERAFIGKEL